MNYEQYQQIYNAAKAQIADRVSKLQPRAGNNASVNGSGISIEVGRAEEAAAEETWSFALLCQTEQYSTVGAEYPDYDPSPYIFEEVVAFQPRGSNYWLPFGFDPGIPVPGQLIDIPPDDTGPVHLEGFKRYCSLKFFSSSYGLFVGDLISVGSSIQSDYKPSTFRFPVKVTVELIAINYQAGDSTQRVAPTVVATYTFFVGFEGDKRSFTAPYEDQEFEFRIVNIERTA